MSITVICKNCTKRFDVPESYRGRQGACTSCGAPMAVPLEAKPQLSASAEKAFAASQAPAAGQAGAAPAVPQFARSGGGVSLSPPQPAPAAAQAPQGGAPQQVSIGRQIGKYRLEGRLGGLTSTVFRATSPQGEVAVKVLPAEIVSKHPTVGKRFLREARTLFSLQHPHVIRSMDAGEELGTYYLVMEYVPGFDLRATLQQQPDKRLPEEEALRAARGIAEGLAFLNQNNLVHRNLKPEHVMYDDGEVKLVGLGLIRDAEASNDGPQVTVKGAVVGTPAYMSPEQARAGDLDIRTDLYAVGISLFELLTGEVPFQAKGVAQVLRMVTQDPCPDVRTKAPGVSEGTAAIIAKLTEKKPDARYQTPKDLMTDLDAVLEGGKPPIASMAAGTGKSSGGGERKIGRGAPEPGRDSELQKLTKIVAVLGVLIVILIVALVAVAIKP